VKKAQIDTALFFCFPITVIKSTVRFRHWKLLFCILFCSTWYLSAEEVAKFAWTGSIAGFDNTTLNPPVKTVAMSEYIYVSNNIFEQTEPDPCSIVFIIDNSASNNGSDGTDPNGKRYEAVRDLITYINQKAPETKVGLVIFGSRLWFYGPDNRSLFVSVPKDQYHDGDGCFIPPLDLKKMYSGTAAGFPGGTISYNKTGYEVLQMYLQTKPDPHGGVTAAYEPNHHVNYPFESQGGRLTNITRAFDAANQAHLHQTPQLAKKRHFNIFFSDGLATCNTTSPEYPYLNDYVNGTNTPTTFTIYYNSSSSDLQKLQQMTENIKTNGYSESNPEFTDIINLTNWESIKQTLIELFNKILTTTSTTPISISVNASTSNDWDSTGFLHKRMFPLQKGATEFYMELDVHIKRDSLDDNGNVVSTIEKDTTFILEYEVEVGPNTTVPDSMEMIWWGRDMALFHNDDTVIVANNDMQEVAVRFWEYTVDTMYYYDTKEMELFVSSSVNGDVEKLSFDSGSSYFDCKFTLDGNANPIPNDGKLQVSPQDSIVLLLRNTFLPLDTMRKVIPYMEGYAYTVTKGIYFDNNADGHVDSVYLGVSGNKLADNVDAVMDNIDLPAHRDFIVDNYMALAGGIGITVTEKASAILTYCTDEDYIEVADTVELSDDAILLPCKVDIIDSIAPVIMSATLIDSVKDGARDELTVVFSETIETVTESEPFEFYKTTQGILYDVTLSVLSQSNATGVFEVLAVTGTGEIVQGDSIRIEGFLTDKIGDGLGNVQGNPANIRREITVILVEEGLKLTTGIYFDNNADGKVDSIFIGVYGEIEDYIDDLMKEIVLPDYRDFTVLNAQYTTGGIGLDVSEGNSATLTFVNDDDVIKILNKVILPDSMIILPAEVTVIDSVAPVIVSASYVTTIIYEQQGSTISLVNSGSDTLDVVLSETVEKITKDMPFKFYRTAESKEYDAELAVVSQNSNLGRFTVTSVSGVSRISEGDSIRVNWIYTNNVYDALGNNQDNPKNIRRLIDVRVEKDTIYVPLNFTLIPRATILNVNSKEEIDLSEIKDMGELQEVFQSLPEGEKGYIGVMIITLTPDPVENVSNQDSYTGTLHIFDAVGNEVARDIPMGYHEKTKRLIGLWNGRNTLGRIVGPGGYAAVIPVDFYFNGKKSRRETFGKTIGVKE